jgi:hypothetical protein
MREHLNVTIPVTWIQRIDKDRKDVSRSKFVLRLFEKAYGEGLKEVEEA